MLQKLIQQAMDDSLQPISGMDATFLYGESANSPMHIATLGIVEGSLSFETFKHGLKAKLHKIPKFKKRLVHVPLDLDYPYWADDPNFDLDIHVRRVALPAPNNWEVLRELVTSIFSTPLDLRRPLWSVHFIEGLDNLSQLPKGSVAVFTKVHHVMIDGVSGLGIMGILFDKDPKVRLDNMPITEEKKVKALPDDLTLLAKSSLSLLKDPFKIPKAVGKYALKNLETRIKDSVEPSAKNIYSIKVPRTIFNKAVSPKRTWGTAILSLDRVKALKKKQQVTINDVLLGICAGALRRYLIERDALPELPLVANVPISTRKESDKESMNNQIANMFIPLATNISDPIERLELINEQTRINKQRQQALGASTLSDMADAIPFGLANLAARIYSKYQLNELHSPPFNVTITNVPGPRNTMYLDGHKLTDMIGLTPVVNGFGLIIAIFSYNGNLTITATSDVDTMPDADKFARYIRESANELEALVLQQKEKEEQEESKPFLTLSFVDQLATRLKKVKRIAKKDKGIFHLEVTKEDKQLHLRIDTTKATATVKNRNPKKSDLHIKIADQHLDSIIKGELFWEEALVQGRIQLEGDSSKWEAFQNLLNKVLDE